jgi:hypothetical protein
MSGDPAHHRLGHPQAEHRGDCSSAHGVGGGDISKPKTASLHSVLFQLDLLSLPVPLHSHLLGKASDLQELLDVAIEFGGVELRQQPVTAAQPSVPLQNLQAIGRKLDQGVCGSLLGPYREVGLIPHLAKRSGIQATEVGDLNLFMVCI